MEEPSWYWATKHTVLFLSVLHQYGEKKPELCHRIHPLGLSYPPGAADTSLFHFLCYVCNHSAGKPDNLYSHQDRPSTPHTNVLFSQHPGLCGHMFHHYDSSQAANRPAVIQESNFFLCLHHPVAFFPFIWQHGQLHAGNHGL